MLTLSHSFQRPVRTVLTTMAHADSRLSRLVGQLACALIVMSLVVAALGCAPLTRIANEGLDQATLLLCALLPVLSWSDKRTQ